ERHARVHRSERRPVGPGPLDCVVDRRNPARHGHRRDVVRPRAGRWSGRRRIHPCPEPMDTVLRSDGRPRRGRDREHDQGASRPRATDVQSDRRDTWPLVSERAFGDRRGLLRSRRARPRPAAEPADAVAARRGGRRGCDRRGGEPRAPRRPLAVRRRRRSRVRLGLVRALRHRVRRPVPDLRPAGGEGHPHGRASRGALDSDSIATPTHSRDTEHRHLTSRPGGGLGSYTAASSTAVADSKVNQPSADDHVQAGIVVGPMLRYVGTESATIWLETTDACEVAVLGHTAKTFHVEDHHYALVVLEGLEPESVTPYDVRLDGRLAWPADDERPPSVIRTRKGDDHARLVFGSCRLGHPEETPYTLSPSEDERGVGTDALWAYAQSLQRGDVEWPDAVALVGDQVYADEVSPATETFIRSRRDVQQPPGEQIADFEEYTRLYREAWSNPDVRWLLSTVPTTMIFDDHDVHDDWNISEAWVAEMHERPWWEARITGAFMAYWLYQHLGNLSPDDLV